jgi:hypothetical protein
MTRGSFRLFLDGYRSTADGYSTGRVEVARSLTYAEGAGDGQIDRVYEAEVEVPIGGGGVELDLQALDTTPDGALNADTIKAITLEADAANVGAVKIEPGSTNPWLGLFSGGGVSLALRAGEVHAFASRIGWPVSPTSKTLKLSHGESGSQFVKVSILASAL